MLVIYQESFMTDVENCQVTKMKLQSLFFSKIKI